MDCASALPLVLQEHIANRGIEDAHSVRHLEVMHMIDNQRSISLTRVMPAYNEVIDANESVPAPSNTSPYVAQA
jgi:hypothetical protein